MNRIIFSAFLVVGIVGLLFFKRDLPRVPGLEPACLSDTLTIGPKSLLMICSDGTLLVRGKVVMVDPELATVISYVNTAIAKGCEK